MLKIIAFVSANWGNSLALEWIKNIVVSVHVGFGIAVLAGGVARFPYPTYQPLIALVHGQIWIWSIWILTAAALMMIPSKWPQVLGLWLGMCWHFMWAAAFMVAIVKYPTAGATATVAYAGFALLDAALLSARLAEPKKKG